MQPRFLNHPAAASGSSSRPLTKPPGRPASPYPLLRLPTALPAGISNVANRTTSSSLAILEAVDKLASMSLDGGPRNSAFAQEVPPSLIRGFKATIPSSELAKQRRRVVRGGLVEEELGGKIGLKKLGDRARGLLTERGEEDERELDMGRKSRKRRKARESRRKSEGRHLEGRLHLEDLVKQAEEIRQDKENLHVRTVSRPHYSYVTLILTFHFESTLILGLVHLISARLLPHPAAPQSR
jgi:division protein 1